MKNMKRLFAIMISFALLLMTACEGRSKGPENEIIDNTVEGEITWETSTLGIDPESKDFEAQLESGNYYVVHDGIYYPIVYHFNSDSAAPDKVVDPKRQCYFTTETEICIPTLFEGDELIYYNTDQLLDYIVWERYYDLGYTIGIRDIQEMKSGRMFLDLSDDKDMTIIPDSELTAMYDLNCDEVLLDKISNITITSDLISDGLITSTQKSRTYDLEIYTGTYFKHYLATANIHAFKAYELYASIEYETLQDCFYKVNVPEYLVNGYYFLDNVGMLRLVRGNSYSEDTNFNEQVLFPKVNEDAWDYDPDAYVAPFLYSAYPPLNEFETNIEGKLGYVSDEEEDNEEQVDEKIGSVILKEATVKEIPLWFPRGSKCTIKVTSSKGETTGDIYVLFNNKKKYISYNRIDDVYEATFNGTGEKASLVISGLWKSYNVELINCEQYTGQDLLENQNTTETMPETAAQDATQTTEAASEASDGSVTAETPISGTP